MQMTQLEARWVVQPHHEYLHIPAYTQGPRHCFWCSCGRRSAPPDDAHRASATHSQEFNWYMEVALPAGDTQNVFSVLSDVQFFQCIIWIALALIAVIPVVVGLFPPLDDIRLTISQAFGVLDLNSMFLSPLLFFPSTCVDRG